jgi:hypothetical protein
MRIRRRIWEIVEVAQPGDPASRVFDVLISGFVEELRRQRGPLAKCPRCGEEP